MNDLDTVARMLGEARAEITELKGALEDMLRAFSSLGVELHNEGSKSQQDADNRARRALGQTVRTRK